MGTVYRETYTKPLPDDAELLDRKGEHLARWIDGRGRKQTAKVTTGQDGSLRIIVESSKYTAKYRNGAGHVVKVATGCRSKDAATTVLKDLQHRADKVRSGGWTVAEDAVLDHQTKPIGEHVAAYLKHLKRKRGKGRKPKVAKSHVASVTQQLKQLTAECGFQRLRDLNRDAAERWADKRETEGAAGKTVNLYLSSLTAFGSWCIESKRLVANPFARLPKRDERSNQSRQRRAMTEDELRRLLYVGRLRPVAEYGRKVVKNANASDRSSKKSRRTWTKEPLTMDNLEAAAERGRHALRNRPDYLATLELRGRERATVYKMLVLTGLRKGELSALRIKHLELDGPLPCVLLEAVDDKAGRGADIPLRADLAADLRGLLADRLDGVRAAARTDGEPIPAKLPADMQLLDVPTGLIRIFDRDIVTAGIAKLAKDEHGRTYVDKRDDRGRTIDVHALRHSFGTLLSKGGVAPRTAQAAMRHSTLELTMNTYTDPRLLDVAGAIGALPELPLDASRGEQRQRATGTAGGEPTTLQVRKSKNTGKSDDCLYQNSESKPRKRNVKHADGDISAPTFFVPILVPNTGNRCTPLTFPDNSTGDGAKPPMDVSAYGDKGSERVTRADTLEPSGLEPPTSWLQTRRSPS